EAKIVSIRGSAFVLPFGRACLRVESFQDFALATTVEKNDCIAHDHWTGEARADRLLPENLWRDAPTIPELFRRNTIAGETEELRPIRSLKQQYQEKLRAHKQKRPPEGGLWNRLD